MRFDVYCDESRPDLFAGNISCTDKYLFIGSLWLPFEKRAKVKNQLKQIRRKFGMYTEVKWQKVCPSKKDVYIELIDLFINYGPDLRFRCIAIEPKKVDLMRYHQNDRELGFYKFYYQLLHHWILDFNEYHIFCDLKTNRVRDRLNTLSKCLQNANLSAVIHQVQALPSKDTDLIQLTDLLLGAVSARINDAIKRDGAKMEVIEHLEQRLGKGRLRHTPRAEQKFNIFVIDLKGGW